MDKADPEVAGEVGDGFRVVVPTRDSAAWIAMVADAYRRVGVRPLFVVDKRSTDGTDAVLAGAGADISHVVPVDDCVEDIIWRIPALTDARWVLRMDDDEMPSAGLLQWVRANLGALTLPKVAFPRRWALYARGGRLSYAEHKQLYYMQSRPDLLDPQVRLFRPDKVKYVRKIHTPGFSIDGGMHIAPREAYICHFDWIARTFEERHAKLMRYELALPGCGSSLLHFYLPELVHPLDRCEVPFETDEFDSLAAMFVNYRMRTLPGMTAVA
jgi:hypothetical protein